MIDNLDAYPPCPLCGSDTRHRMDGPMECTNNIGCSWVHHTCGELTWRTAPWTRDAAADIEHWKVRAISHRRHALRLGHLLLWARAEMVRLRAERAVQPPRDAPPTTPHLCGLLADVLRIVRRHVPVGHEDRSTAIAAVRKVQAGVHALRAEVAYYAKRATGRTAEQERS